MIQIQIQDLVGIPFLNKGRNKDEGYDCWGLAMEVFRRSGITILDYGVDCMDVEAIQGVESVQVSESEKGIGKWEEVPIPVVGDTDIFPLLVLIRNHPIFYNHVGVYIGEGRIIHCQEGTGVIMQSLSMIHKGRVGKFYRWKGDLSIVL